MSGSSNPSSSHQPSIMPFFMKLYVPLGFSVKKEGATRRTHRDFSLSPANPRHANFISAEWTAYGAKSKFTITKLSKVAAPLICGTEGRTVREREKEYLHCAKICVKYERTGKFRLELPEFCLTTPGEGREMIDQTRSLCRDVDKQNFQSTEFLRRIN